MYIRKLLLLMILMYQPVFAGVITIDYGVQDNWWQDGIAQGNNNELRLNRIDQYDQRIGVQFTDLSALAGQMIVSAELQLYRYYGQASQDPLMADIEAYEITESWQVDDAMPETAPEYFAVESFYSERSENGWHSWDISDLLINWLIDPNSNNGVMLWNTGDAYFQKFYASENVGFGPKLVVTTEAVAIEEPQLTLLFLFIILSLLWRKRRA